MLGTIQLHVVTFTMNQSTLFSLVALLFTAYQIRLLRPDNPGGSHQHGFHMTIINV